LEGLDFIPPNALTRIRRPKYSNFAQAHLCYTLKKVQISITLTSLFFFFFTDFLQSALTMKKKSAIANEILTL
jgi:hypothetical protein